MRDGRDRLHGPARASVAPAKPVLRCELQPPSRGSPLRGLDLRVPSGVQGFRCGAPKVRPLTRRVPRGHMLERGGRRGVRSRRVGVRFRYPPLRLDHRGGITLTSEVRAMLSVLSMMHLHLRLTSPGLRTIRFACRANTPRVRAPNPDLLSALGGHRGLLSVLRTMTCGLQVARLRFRAVPAA
jgi:hypothetical protein